MRAEPPSGWTAPTMAATASRWGNVIASCSTATSTLVVAMARTVSMMISRSR